MKQWKKHVLPKWAEKRILEIYEQNIQIVERRRKSVNLDSMLLNGKSIDAKLISDLRKYSFAVGEVAALESVMDRFFIEYDDMGRVPELYL